MEGRSAIEPDHVFPPPVAELGEAPGCLTFQEATRAFQRRLLLETLEATDWNVSEAARRLDIVRSHVYNLIHAFQLSREECGHGVVGQG
jgi:transcriptional regulator of acetoin/glycerol metabolism